MPGILTDQDCRPAPWSIERLHTPAGFDEALFVEDSVRWQENLSMDVPDAGCGTTQARVQARGIEPVPVDLIEAERDVQWSNTCFLVLPTQVVEQLISR